MFNFNHYFDRYHALGLIAMRTLMGVTFLIHGLAKIAPTGAIGGIIGWSGMLAGLGAPLPGLLAWLVVFLEIGGGVLLIAGLGVRLVSALFIINMLVATWAKLQWGAQFTQFDGTGYEFDLLLIVANFILLAVGPGRWALDTYLGWEVNPRGMITV